MKDKARFCDLRSAKGHKCPARATHTYMYGAVQRYACQGHTLSAERTAALMGIPFEAERLKTPESK